MSTPPSSIGKCYVSAILAPKSRIGDILRLGCIFYSKICNIPAYGTYMKGSGVRTDTEANLTIL